MPSTFLTSARLLGYNQGDNAVAEPSSHNLSPCQEARRPPERGFGASGLTRTPEEKAQQRDAAREARREATHWRRQFGSLVASECGVAFEPDHATYHQRIPGPRAEFQSRPLTQGDVDASEEFLAELVAMPDIDPDQEEDVFVRGERLSAYKAHLLQRLGRSFGPVDHEAKAGKDPQGGVW